MTREPMAKIRKHHILLMATAVTALVACISWAEEPYYAKVIGITDGDMITVLRNKTPITIRLYGIETPEMGQAFATKAKQFTAEQVSGKSVIVMPIDTDRYGRPLALVQTQDATGILNEALIEVGLAWVYRKYCKAEFCTDWLTIEDVARASGHGIWTDPDPIPPWEYRKK